MKKNRNLVFDNNRFAMENQLQNIVEQQEAQILALQARVEQLIAAQHPVQQPPQRFVLSTEQFLNYIHKLRKFNGKDEFTVQEFINSVERTFLLCNDDPGLREYAMGIIINDKIQGEAKRCIQRLGDHINNRWEEVKQELRLHFRPREDYAELLNKCRTLKVSTLRELFQEARKINYKLNELYDFDETKPETYQPSNNDRYLVDIISNKIHGFLRGNIPENATIIHIYNKFERLKLLDNENAIDFRSRKNKLNATQNVNVNFNGQNKISTNTNQYNNHLLKDKNVNQNDSKNQSNRDGSHMTNHRNSTNFSQQHRNRNFTNISNNGSGQYRNQHPNWSPHRHYSQENGSNPVPEPMEIGNLSSDQDVNFQEEPRDQNFQL